ncbi:MAG: hypothetical protein RSA29_13610 [Clostridium sp.]|uniref:glucosamine inositolphosphorylceramide transferase family protein n=1 Tax=Clostridium sp. TaxID=1506 RepID=UPI00305FF053
MKKNNLKKIIISLASILVILVFIKSLMISIEVFKSNNKSEQIWSIGIYEGDDILNLNDKKDIVNPIITANDVTDISAKFVADPFLINDGQKNYLFFEVLDNSMNKGVIGLATSDDLNNWTYDKVVLEEEFHLSYPYVFEYNNEFYMLPEGGNSGYLNLYKSKNFPYEWEKISSLLRGNYPDASIFQYDDKWWILSTKREKNGGTHFDNLHLYYSDNLTEGWKEHIKSPIITNDASISRPAGKVLVDNNKIIRFAQKDEARYGEGVSAFEITKLTESEYEEKLIGEVVSGSGIKGSWNEGGMHQSDVHKNEDGKYIVVVDGDYTNKYNVIFKNYIDKIKRFIGLK